MTKEIMLDRNGYYTYWRNNADSRQCVDVDVYIGERTDNNMPILEWTYGKVVGNSILGNANLWLDQALLEARSRCVEV